MSNLKIKKQANGNYIVPFLDENKNVKLDKNDNPRGYIVLVEEDFRIIGRGSIDKDKYCTVSGTHKTLNKIIDNALNGKGNIEGRINTIECLENELFESDSYLKKAFLGSDTYIDDKGFDNLIQPYIKKVAKDGPELKATGQRIISFKSYDPTGQLEDQLVRHDNVEEVAAWRLAKNSAIAPSTAFDDSDDTGKPAKANKPAKVTN